MNLALFVALLSAAVTVSATVRHQQHNKVYASFARPPRQTSDPIPDPNPNNIPNWSSNGPRILTIRLAASHKDVSYNDEGGISVRLGQDVKIKLYGWGFNNSTQVKLTTDEQELGATCKSESLHVQSETFSVDWVNTDGDQALLSIPGEKMPVLKGQDVYYFCLKNQNTGGFMHQGNQNDIQIEVYELLLPIWLMIVIIVILLCLSGLFSGLNLGLMALDQTELKIVQNTGTENERSYANKIAPIRAHGNFLLCSLLLGNVLVNNSLTILLDTLTSGLVAVIGATMGIVVFGEIIPQAICSRHGLAVGAYTIWLTKFFMLLTFPLSFPISILLDKLLGAEIGTVYDKKKLIELLRVTDDNNDLEKEEIDIVTGALVYKDKTVKDVMTKIEDVYMLPLDTILNFDTVAEIREQGYSRIPIYSGDQKNIVHILFAKDLMFIDPDDKMPVSMVCEFYQNDVNLVFHDTPLNVMFNEFKGGDKGHMAFVQEICNSGDGDPFYDTIGLVTLEDIIEEIIQQEIVDETDVITDNRTKKRRKKWVVGREANFPSINQDDKMRRVNVSPQMSLAVFQFLITSIQPFKVLADPVLRRLLTLDVFREIKIKKDKTKMNEEDLIIIQKGKVIDYFVLIIEGKAEVNIGREELIFDAGPFTYFGVQSLTDLETPNSPMLPLNKALEKGSLKKANTQQNIDFVASSGNSKRHSVAAPGGNKERQSNTSLAQVFIPDYTVKATTDVLYLKIKKATYVRALKATQMTLKGKGPNGPPGEHELMMEGILAKMEQEESDMVIMRSPDKNFDSPSLLQRKDLRLSKGSPSLSLEAIRDEFWGDEDENKDKVKVEVGDSGVKVEVKNTEINIPTNNGPHSLPVTLTTDEDVTVNVTDDEVKVTSPDDLKVTDDLSRSSRDPSPGERTSMIAKKDSMEMKDF